MCGRCHARFGTHSQLFKQSEEHNHMVISEGDEDDHINRSANKRGSRKISRSDRKFRQLSIHKQENFEEVGSIGDWLRSHGWETDEAANHWTIEVADALSVPTAPFGFVKSRVVKDSKSGHIVDTLLPSPTTRLEQMHRIFKSARDVHVVMEVYEKAVEESIAWGDQDVSPGPNPLQGICCAT